MKNVEQETSFVFGSTFKDYNEKELREFINCLKIRLVKNNIPLDIFKDKICLDAGCGGGRASVMMCELGANAVIAVDASKDNCNTIMKIRSNLNLPISVYQKSILDIDYNEDFDIVWCNGVLHHTINPTEGLRNLVKALKPNGYMWIYLYGVGGIYWYIIDQIRERLKWVSSEEVLKILQDLNYSTSKIAEFMDDWKVPILERYTAGNVESILSSLGLSYSRLINGINYDTCYRNMEYGQYALMGEGDLRYWCQKKEVKLINITSYMNLDEVNINFPEYGTIKFCADLQIKLRDEMSKDQPFDLEKFKESI